VRGKKRKREEKGRKKEREKRKKEKRKFAPRVPFC